jgi:mannose/fructose/N-acetylgalactosamine-specific phosphotransferase system component IID
MKKRWIFLKSLLFTSNLNVSNMQGTGYKYLIDEIAKANKIDLPPEVLQNQLGYFNSHPFMINFIIGVWFKEYLNGGDPDYFKKVYGSALAALGDSFFWHTLRPLSFVLSAIFAIYEPIAGLIFYFLFFNMFHLFFLMIGFDAGYYLGKEIIWWFNKIKFNRWSMYGDIISVFFFGVLISMLIKMNIGLQIDLFGIIFVFVCLGFLFAKRIDVTHGLIFSLILLILIVFVRGG